ncbi:MAG: hypothetical protein ACI4TW_04890 [Prevotella sp.]
MNQKNYLGTVVAAIVMLVAFFLLPLFSPSTSEMGLGMLNMVLDRIPTTMVGMLLAGSMGSKLCLLLMLLSPVYLLLHAYQDRLPIPKAAFPLPFGLAALFPFILAVFLGFYLDGSFMFNGDTEDNMETIRGMAYFTAATKVGWAYYIYLAAALVSAWTSISNGNDFQSIAVRKGCAIAVAALALIIVANSQSVLISNDRHTIFKFNDYYQLTTNGMMMGFGWIFVLFCLYIAVSAFRDIKALESYRKLLLPVKVSGIVILIFAILVLIVSFGFASTGDDMRGPASLSILIIAVGMVILASTPTGEKKAAPLQDTVATDKKERKPSWLAANKKKVGIGLSIALVILLLVVLIPKACRSGSAIDEDIELVEPDTVTAEEIDEPTDTGVESPSFVLDKGTLGPIAIGKLYTDLPQNVEGLYDCFGYKSETHEDEMDGDWTEEYVMFYKDGKEVFSTGIDGKKIISVTLLNNAIKTADGYHVGYNARKLFQEKPMQWENYYMGEVFASKNGYTYFVSSDDLNAEIPEKVSDFKADATVSKIVYN